jgi:integrase
LMPKRGLLSRRKLEVDVPRPRNPIGTYGVINTAEIAPGRWRARTLYRFEDGKRRQVERVRAGKTGSKAVHALKEALKDISVPLGTAATIDADTRLSDLGDLFLQAKTEAGKTVRTVDTYRHNLTKIIKPLLGDLRISEATPARLQRFITTVAKENGPGAAKGCRSVLSGMFAMAVRNDAVRSNPVAAVEGIAKGPSRASSAIPLEEVPKFRQVVRDDAELQRLDLSDLLEFMLFTGCRIGEALALRWQYVDLDDKTVTFRATVSRAKGHGLVLQEHGKTESSARTIQVPDEVLELLRRRLAADLPSGELVFPSMLGKLRDTSNTEADWRANRDRLGYPALSSHAFRKTVATALDVSGLSARAIAEYLGHKRPSMTQDVYMSRRAGGDESAAKLTRMFGVSSESPLAG